MPSLCGEPVRYSCKALAPLALLQTAAATPTNYPNIRAIPGPSRPASVATPTSLGSGKGAGLIRRASAALASSSSGHVTTSNGSHSGHVTSSNGSHSGHVTSSNGSQNMLQTVPSRRETHSQRDLSRSSDPNHQVSNQGTSNRVVPVFRPTQSSRQPLSAPQQAPKKSAPIVPSFKSVRPPTRSQTVPTSPAPTRLHHQGGQTNNSHCRSTSQQGQLNVCGKKRHGSTGHSLQPPSRKQCHSDIVSVLAPSTAGTSGGGGGEENRVRGGRCNTVQHGSLGAVGHRSEQTVPDLSLVMQTDIYSLSTSLDHQYTSVHSGTTHKKVHIVTQETLCFLKLVFAIEIVCYITWQYRNCGSC